MKQAIGIILVLLVMVSCKKEVGIVDVSHIPVKVKVAEYHRDFFNADSVSLQDVKSRYPYMFPNQITDKDCLEKIHDSLQQVLFNKVEAKFRDFSLIETQLEDLYQRVKYYYPKFKEPIFITNVGDVDYRTNIMYADSLLLCSLDMYLGTDSEVYVSYPKYIAQNFKAEAIIRDVANKMVNTWYPYTKDRSFIGRLVFEGKKQYIISKFVPHVSDAVLLGYSNDKMQWTKENEEATWLYFLKHDLLYSTDSALNKRFIDLAPFSKFFLPIDKFSPGGIGKYTGLQIVRAYMSKNPDTSMKDLMMLDAEQLFQASKYKPRK